MVVAMVVVVVVVVEVAVEVEVAVAVAVVVVVLLAAAVAVAATTVEVVVVAVVEVVILIAFIAVYFHTFLQYDSPEETSDTPKWLRMNVTGGQVASEVKITMTSAVADFGLVEVRVFGTERKPHTSCTS